MHKSETGEKFFITPKLKCTYVKSQGLGNIILPFMLKKHLFLFNNV